MDKAKACNFVRGLVVGRENVEVSHLQFADDTLFSLEAVVEGMKNLLKLLKVFCLVSGLRINMKKEFIVGYKC